MRAARITFGLLSLWAVATCGCSKKSDGAAPAASGSAAAISSAKVVGVPPRCRAIRDVNTYTIASADQKPAPNSDEEGADFLPFAVELGEAVATPSGFAVSAIRSEASATHALLLLLGGNLSGRPVALGRAFGDAQPPELATHGGDVLVAMTDAEPNGRRLKLGKISGTGETPIAWGAELSQAGLQPEALDLAASGGEGLIVWEQLDKKTGITHIQSAGFRAEKPDRLSAVRVLSPDDHRAENPVLVARSGGFWLGYLTQPAEALTVRKPAKADKAAPRPNTSDHESELLVDMGPRALALLALDQSGAAVHPPIIVTSSESHVLVFDLTTTTDGAALVAWRDDPASPGVETRTVHLALVRPDGSVRRELIEDEDVGAGLPELIADPSGGATWLGLASISDATRLAPLDGLGKPAGELQADPLVGSAEPVARSGNRLLLARPNGLAVDLSLIECGQGAAPKKTE